MKSTPWPVADPRLHGSLHKLKRAKAHLHALAQSTQRFREEHNYRLIRHGERKGKVQVWTWDVEQTKPFPFYWPILAGEVLYQVNSALDHLAWELAFLKSAPEEPDRVTFPIFPSHGRFWRRNKEGFYRQGSGGWRLQRIPHEARRLILDVQPYKRSDGMPKHPLALLFDLSNEDKHKALHVAHAAPRDQILKDPRLKNARILRFGIDRDESFDDRLDKFASLHVLVIGSQAHIKADPGFHFEEVFSRSAPPIATGEPFFETLRLILNYVIDDVFMGRFVPYFNSLD
jgi:hypothetical protein